MASVPGKRPLVVQRTLDPHADSDDDLFLPIASEDSSKSLPGSWSETTGANLMHNGLSGKITDINLNDNKNRDNISTTSSDGVPGMDCGGGVAGPSSDATSSMAITTGYNHWGYGSGCSNMYGSSASIVEGLLLEIYDRWQYPQRDSLDSDTFTECSSTSEAFWGRGDTVQLDFVGQRHAQRFNKVFLEGKGRRM